MKGRVVEGRRGLQKGIPGKNDEADTVAFEAFHEVHDRQLGAVETRGAQVGGQHALRAV